MNKIKSTDLNIKSDAKKQIQDAVNLLSEIFDKDLLGVYLYGSSAVGGLQKYSDIDLFVVLGRASTNAEKSKLTNGLLKISGIYMRGEKPPIEMTLVEKTSVNPWQYPPSFDFQYGEWLREELEKGNIEPWLNKEMPDLALLITQVLLASITLLGDAPEELLCKVPYHDFISAITDELPNLISELETDTRNVLLTLARIWSTVSTNRISSKPLAASWCIRNLPEEYKAILERAKSIYQGYTEEYWGDLQELIKPCADFILEQINNRINEIKSLADFNEVIKIDSKDLSS
jgi:streptomycin 3"-adenylyltransferase